jgi:hypothetical protein
MVLNSSSLLSEDNGFPFSSIFPANEATGISLGIRPAAAPSKVVLPLPAAPQIRSR